MNPLVSIIISSYNHSFFIKKTLDSIKADTYPNKEIVIIDDGSKDNSVEIVNKWICLNSGMKVIFLHRENRGFCATLNQLVEISNGQYIVIVASDDLLTNNSIAERVKILGESGKMVIVSDAEVIDSEENLLFNSMLSGYHNAKKENYSTSEGILDEILFNFAISGAVVMMDKRIFSLIGKYPEDLKAEDLYFYISAAAKKELLFYDCIVSKYRIHADNTSGINPELTTAIIKTYKRLFFNIPGLIRKFRVFKRVAGIFYHHNLKSFRMIKCYSI